MVHLSTLGWNSYFQDQWTLHGESGRQPARIVEAQKEAFRAVAESGEMAAEVTGHFRHAAVNRSHFPAVGDWVAVSIPPGEQKALIHSVLPRRTKLSRKVAGDGVTEQILATNVDSVLVVTSLNAEFKARRVERYLTAIWESGARPVLILNKADLCPEAPEVFIPGVDVHIVSALTGHGLDALDAYTQPGTTVVLVGSSGVGKSTLINRLFNTDLQPTREIRADDDRGRHTTTYRRMFVLPTGGIFIDTPGLRELQLWDAADGLEEVFEDIASLASGCRFRDCRHQTEPGCAVRESIDPARLGNYHKLKREMEYLDRKKDAAVQAEEKKIWKKRQKALRQHYKLRR